MRRELVNSRVVCAACVRSHVGRDAFIRIDRDDDLSDRGIDLVAHVPLPEQMDDGSLADLRQQGDVAHIHQQNILVDDLWMFVLCFVRLSVAFAFNRAAADARDLERNP